MADYEFCPGQRLHFLLAKLIDLSVPPRIGVIRFAYGNKVIRQGPPLQFRHTTHTVDCCNCVTFAIQPADGGPGLEVDNKVEALRGCGQNQLLVEILRTSIRDSASQTQAVDTAMLRS